MDFEEALRKKQEEISHNRAIGDAMYAMFARPTEHGIIGEAAAGLGRGILNVLATPASLADVAGEALGWEGLEQTGEAIVEAKERYIEESPRLRKSESISGNILENPQLWTDPRWYASIASEGLPTIASMLIPGTAAAKIAKAAGYGAKGIKAARVAGGLGAGMGLEAGGAADQIRQYEEQTGETVPVKDKLFAVMGTGAVAGSLEYVPIFALFGKKSGSLLISRVLQGMAAEGSTEGAQGLVANAFAKAGYDPDQRMVDGVVESIVGGVMLGGGMGAVSRATNFQERIDETNPDEVAGILEQAEDELAQEAEPAAATELSQLQLPAPPERQLLPEPYPKLPAPQKIVPPIEAWEQAKAKRAEILKRKFQPSPRELLEKQKAARIKAKAELEPDINKFLRRGPEAEKRVEGRSSHIDNVIEQLLRGMPIAEAAKVADVWNKLWKTGTEAAKNRKMIEAQAIVRARPELFELVRDINGDVEMMSPEEAKALPAGQGFKLVGHKKLPTNKERILAKAKERKAIIFQKRTISPGIWGTKNGLPFKDRSTARFNRMRMEKESGLNLKDVEVEGGWGLEELVKPVKKPLKAKPSNIRTLRGAIKNLGGINFLNFAGELKDLNVSDRITISRKQGVGIDSAINELIADGWLAKDTTVSSFLEELRTNPKAMLSRDRIARDVSEKKKHELSEQEKRLKEETEYDTEAPPEGEYVTMNAEDLPVGKKMVLMEDKTAEGWDVYEVIETSDPFEVVLQDGKKVVLSPLDRVHVLKKDLGKGAVDKLKQSDLFSARQPAASKVSETQIDLFGGKPRETKRRGKKGRTTGAAIPYLEKSTDYDGAKVESRYPEVISNRKGNYKSGVKSIHGAQDAAAFADLNLSKYPQEHLAVLILDKNKNIISVNRHTIGTRGSSQVDTVIIAGHALNVKNAASIVLVHNHPGSRSVLSKEDILVLETTKNLLEGTKVTALDIVAVGKGKFSSAVEGRENEYVIPKTEAKYEIPMVERVFKTKGKNLYNVKNSKEAIAFGKDNLPEGGLILLSNGNDVVGVLPIKKYHQLRGELSEQILKQIEVSNAVAMIAYNPDSKITKADMDNLQKFANATSMSLFDIIDSVGSSGDLKALSKTKETKFFSAKSTEQQEPSKPQETVTQSDLESIFSGMKNVTTGVNEAGNFFFKVEENKPVEILEVDHIKGYVNTSSGKIPIGSFLKNTVELKTTGVGPTADTSTVFHEFEHYLEDNNILSKDDINALNDATGKKDATSEDRADYVGDNLADWQSHSNSKIRQILKKIADFMNAVYELVARTRTAKGVLRDIKSGEISAKRGKTLVGKKYGADELQTSLEITREPQHATKEEKREAYPDKQFQTRPSATEEVTVSTAGELAAELEANRTYANQIHAKKDLAVHEAKVKAAALERQIKELTGTGKRKGIIGRTLSAEEMKFNELAARKLSQAMFYYRESLINPEKGRAFENYAVRELMTAKGEMKIQLREQLETYRRSQKLTDKQKQFVDKTMDKAFDEVGKKAKDAGIINKTIDNYVRRIIKLPDNWAGSGKYGFKTFTTASMKRKAETIYDHFMQGRDLKVSGIANAYSEIANEVAAIAANKNFIKASMSIGVLTTNKKPGYFPLKATGFTVWARKAGAKIKTAPDEPGLLQVDTHGRKIFFAPPTVKYGATRIGKGRVSRYFETKEDAQAWVQKKGADKYVIEKVQQANVFEKVPLYAPAQIATMLNKMTKTDSGMFESPVMKGLLRFNSAVKGWVLLSSFFHHMAGQRSWSFGVDHEIASALKKGQVVQAIKNIGTMLNSVSAHKRGIEKIKAGHAELSLLIKQGLTLGEMQDWDEALLREQGGLTETFARKLGAEKIVKGMEAVRIKREMFTNALFKRYFAGLKAEAAVIEFTLRVKKVQQEGKIPNTDAIAEQVARLINADFGGLHLARMGRGKDMQKMLRLLLLASDWCCDSVTRAMTKTGWKYYNELEVGKDEILAFNPDTKKLEWSLLKDMYVNDKYDGKMIQINNFNRCIMMTPDHKCYVYNSTTKKNDVVLAKDLQTNHQIPRCADFDTPEEATYSDFFVKLVGWIVSDGHVKKSRWKLADGTAKTYRYGRISQAKPPTVQILKEMGLEYRNCGFSKSHDNFVSNYPCYTFKIPKYEFDMMEEIGVSDGLNWEFLSKLTKHQLQLLYDTIWLADGTGQKRLCGQESPVFYITMLQTMLGLPTTFYQQEEKCWRTRWITRGNGISCWGHHNNKKEVDYSGTIWCPSVETGFWMAEREGLMFITGNTESNFRTFTGMVPGANKLINRLIDDMPPPPGMGKVYRNFWGGVIIKASIATVLAQAAASLWDDDEDKDWRKEEFLENFSRLKWTGVNVSGIYRSLGIDLDENQRKVFSVVGHFADPLKVVHPEKLIKGKGSPLTRMAGAAMTKTDWRERPYTSFGEWMSTGKLKKKSRHEPKENFWEALPSIATDQVISMQPIQVGYMLRYLQGEEDGLSSFLSSAGAHITTAYKPTDVYEHSDQRKKARTLYKKYLDKGRKRKDLAKVMDMVKSYSMSRLNSKDREDIPKLTMKSLSKMGKKYLKEKR